MIFLQSALIVFAGDPGRSAAVFSNIAGAGTRRMIKSNLRQRWPKPLKTISYYLMAVRWGGGGGIGSGRTTPFLHTWPPHSFMVFCFIFSARFSRLGPA